MESTAQGPQSWFLELGFEIATGQRVKERFPLRGLKIYIYILYIPVAHGFEISSPDSGYSHSVRVSAHSSPS